jgi:hypothetical protein
MLSIPNDSKFHRGQPPAAPFPYARKRGKGARKGKNPLGKPLWLYPAAGTFYSCWQKFEPGLRVLKKCFLVLDPLPLC